MSGNDWWNKHIYNKSKLINLDSFKDSNKLPQELENFKTKADDFLNQLYLSDDEIADLIKEAKLLTKISNDEIKYFKSLFLKGKFLSFTKKETDISIGFFENGFFY